MSEYTAKVIRIRKDPHPNADRLSIVRIQGIQCVVRSSDWLDGELAVYLEPDTLVPATPEVSFLSAESSVHNIDGAPFYRLTARRFRGEWSYGLLVKAPAGLEEGDDAWVALGLEHWKPAEPGENLPGQPKARCRAKAEPGAVIPVNDPPVYGLLKLWQWPDLFAPGETVVITEKLHGQNIRIQWDGTEFHVGSHYQWKAARPDSPWWAALMRDPGLGRWLMDHPRWTVYGELVSTQPGFDYGHSQPTIYAFDVLYEPRNGYGEPYFAEWSRLNLRSLELLQAPVLYYGPWDEALAASHVCGPSRVPGAKHMREGIVIESAERRILDSGARAKAKWVSPEYLAAKHE